MLYANGERSVMQLDKRQLIVTLSLEIPMRDMRWMDPAMHAADVATGAQVRAPGWGCVCVRGLPSCCFEKKRDVGLGGWMGGVGG